MNKKNVYLLEQASSIELETHPGFYNETRSINVKIVEGIEYPLVSLDMNPGTESKTYAAPGDDDPDPDDERCY